MDISGKGKTATIKTLLPRACLLALVFLLTLMPLTSSAVQRHGIDVLFVLSADSPAYRDVRNSTLERLRTHYHIEVRADTLPVDKISALNAHARNADLVVAIGTKATEALIRRPLRKPVVYVLVAESTLRKLYDCCVNATQRGASAIVLEQPLSLSARLIHALLPGSRRIGVLLGPTSRQFEDRIRETLNTHDLRASMRIGNSQHDLGPALDHLLRDSDAILAVPDKTVYNRQTLYRLLLASYRRGIPVIAFSRAFVKSGALAAVHTTPGDMGKTLADLIAEGAITRHTKLRIHYPRYFHISINNAVASSLGLTPPDIATLTNRLKTKP